MNFFKLYIGDYQRDTAHLSVTEHGAFLLMLQHYYATEKPLPTGKALHRMLRAQDRQEREAIDAVAGQFWTETPQGLVNHRADEEITKAATQAETNARIAREREDKRKASRERHEQSTNRATNDQPNQTPDTRHQTNTPQPPEGFADFWAVYPNRKARANAEKAWRRLNPSDSLKTEILQALARQCESAEWRKDGGAYVPHGATYLNGRRWEDEIPVAPSLQLVGAV